MTPSQIAAAQRPDQMTPGQKLRVARGNRSLREVARHTGISHVEIYRLEEGLRTLPRYGTLKALAEYYGKSIEEIYE